MRKTYFIVALRNLRQKFYALIDAAGFPLGLVLCLLAALLACPEVINQTFLPDLDT